MRWRRARLRAGRRSSRRRGRGPGGSGRTAARVARVGGDEHGLELVLGLGAGLDGRFLGQLDRRRISAAGPSPVLGVTVARPDSTARAAASASMASVLPRRRRVARSAG